MAQIDHFSKESTRVKLVSQAILPGESREFQLYAYPPTTEKLGGTPNITEHFTPPLPGRDCVIVGKGEAL